MNENLDLVKILNDCPVGTRLYSAIHGEVTLNHVSSEDVNYPIIAIWREGTASFTRYGRYAIKSDGECVLFPSKDQRDWSKFKATVDKFDYSTLKPFDKVLVRDSDSYFWRCNFLSHLDHNEAYCVGSVWNQMIPYDDETKHLLGTCDMPDEKYIWWEE